VQRAATQKLTGRTAVCYSHFLLFALERPFFSDRNIARFAIALAVLMITHQIAGFVTIKSIYALQLGPWSTANYGPFARNFWGGASHFYRMLGIYVIPLHSGGSFDLPGRYSRRGRERRSSGSGARRRAESTGPELSAAP
jgi:hypothetical protein